MDLGVIHSGVGAISKSDMLMALTGSRLVVGFNVDVLPKVEEFSREQGIEVRLYNVIYTLTHDLHELAESLAQNEEEEEKVIGTAKVIALFKSTRKGIILGCEVVKGILALGKRFRITTAMGPIYTGKIESLHIENDAVSVARKGQQVGLKISDFKKGKMGDLVECLETSQKRTKTWQPRAGVFDLSS